MPYTVDIRSSAKRALARLPTTMQERIVRRLEEVETDPRPVGAITL